MGGLRHFIAGCCLLLGVATPTASATEVRTEPASTTPTLLGTIIEPSHTRREATDANGDPIRIIRLAQGRVGVIPIAIALANATVPAGGDPLTVSTTLPDGLTFVRAETGGSLIEGGGAFACASEGQAITCRLARGGGSGGSAPLRPERRYDLYLTVRAAADLVARGTPTGASPANPGDTVTRLADLPVTAQAVTDAGPLSFAFSAQVDATTLPVPPRIYIERVETITTRRSGTYRMRLRNIGGSPAVSTGSVPALRLREVMPRTPRPVRHRAGGTGWRCPVERGRVIDCVRRATLAPGRATPTLTVTWTPQPVLNEADRAPEIWSIRATAASRTTSIVDDEPRVATTTEEFTRRMLLSVQSPKPTTLIAHVRTPNGIALRQGDQQRFEVRLRNNGEIAARGTGLRMVLPAGVRIAGSPRGWRCRQDGPRVTCLRTPSTLGENRETTLTFTLAAADEAPTGRRAVRVTPFARNVHRARTHTLPLAIHDVGDPEATPILQFPAGSGWRTWSRGGSYRVAVDRPLRYRILIRNDGGNVVPAGARVDVRQRIGRGVRLVSATTASGAPCGDDTLGCVITTTAPVAPGQTITSITVVARPTQVVPRADLGAVITRIIGEPGRERLAVPVRVDESPTAIRLSTRILRIPDAGGRGTVEFHATNDQQRHRLGDLVVDIPLPRGVTMASHTGRGWACATDRSGARCAYTGSLRPRTRTPSARLELRATRGAAPTATPTALRWLATGTSSEAGRPERGSVRLALPIRPAIRIAAEASPRVVMPGKDRNALRSVVLRGDGSRGNGISLDYRWRQRCTTAADIRAFGRCPTNEPAPRVRITSPTAAVARALVPAMRTRTTLIFELTIDNGSSTLRRTVEVIAAPTPTLERRAERRRTAASRAVQRQRAAARNAQRAAERARGNAERRRSAAARRTQAAKARTARASVAGRVKVRPGGSALISATPDQELNLVIRVGRGAERVRWSQTGGPKTEIRDATSARARVRVPREPTVLSYVAEVTNASGQTSTALITVNVLSGRVDSRTAPAFCSLVGRARAGSNVTFAGGTSIRFGRVSTPPPSTRSACSSGRARTATSTRQNVTGGSFSASSITIGSLEIANAAGTYTPAGVSITSGTLTLPASWNAPTLSIGSTPLSLAFPSGSSTPELSGSVTTASFAFLPLPSGWAGTTTITFSAGDGSTTAAVKATATDGGSGSVTLSGTATPTGTFDLAVQADELVSIGSATLDLSGSVSNTTGTVVSTISGSIAAPVRLADGVSLTTLTATWNATGAAAGSPIVTGTATVAIQSGSETPTALTANLAYTSTTDWSVTLTASGGPTWTPLPGLQVSPSDFSGSLGQSKGAWQWDVEATVANWTVTDALTLTRTTLDLSNSCSSTTLICPKADLFMLIDTNAAVDMPIGQPIGITADAVFGIGGGSGFSLYADLDNPIDLVEGISITAPSLHVSYDLPAGSITPTTGMPTFTGATEGGWSVNAVGGLNVPGLGNFADIAANITSLGISLGGFDPNGVQLGGASNGAQSSAAFGWSSIPTTMSFEVPGFGTQSLALVPGDISVSGAFDAPTWFGQMTGQSLPKVIGTIQFDPATGFFDATIDIPGTYTIPAGGSRMQVPTLFFEITFNAQGLTVTAGGITDLNVNALGGSTQAAPTLTIELSYDITESHITGTFEFQDATGWDNAFGVDGLVIDDLAISLGITLTPPIPLPTIGLYAAGDLPPSLTRAFGVSNGVPVSITAQLSDENPCLSIQVGSSTGTTPILSIDGGSLTATYFEFAIAPTGCTVGTSTIQPGMAIAFDGALFGTTVDVFASLDLDPLIFVARVDVGAFSIPGTGGGVSFQETIIDVNLNEQTQVYAVDFSGGFSMFGTTIDVSGGISADEATDTVTASLKVAQPQALTVDGFSLRNLSIAANVSYGPTTKDFSIAASGEMNIMGSYIDVEAFDATIDNGVVENVDVEVQAAIDLGAANATGTFSMSYTQSSDDFDLDAAVTLTTAGFSLPATLDISPQCVSFSGSLAVGQVFTATLEGTMVYQTGCTQTILNAAGQSVQGAPGDFSFAAENVALNLADFDVSGDVALGNVAGDAYATIDTTLDLSPQSTNDEVSVTGTIQSNGDFSLNGSANLDIAGILLQMDVTAQKAGSDVTISGSANLALYGSTLALSGEFQEIDGQASTTLNATADITLDGWELANAQFTLAQTPTTMGLNAQVAIDAGGVATLNGTMTFVGSGDAPLYYVAADGTLSIPDLASVQLDGTFTNCTNPSCTQAAGDTQLVLSGDLDVDGATFDFPTIEVDSDGQFSIDSSVSGNPCSGEVYLLVVRGWGCAWYRETLNISNSGFNVSSDQGITIYYEYWLFGWRGPDSFTFGGGFSLSTDPWRACLSVDVWRGHGFSVCIP